MFWQLRTTQTASDALADSKITESRINKSCAEILLFATASCAEILVFATASCAEILLFATSSVPGTEGYRVRQRHLGFSINLLFNPCVLFSTLPIANTRSPIVLLLDDGPTTFQTDVR